MIKERKKLIIIALAAFLGLALTGIAILFVLDSKSQENRFSPSGDSSESTDTSFEGIGNLPKDFPVYQDSEFKTFAQSEDGRGISFIWETGDDADLVIEYLKSELRINGWQLSNESSVGSSSAVSFEKNGTAGFLGVFKGSGDETIISVTIRRS